MKKLILFITILTAAVLFVTLIVHVASAQRACGTMEYLQQQITADSSLPRRLREIETFTQNYIAKHPQKTFRTTPITIPVVVHVLYNTTAQNISDAQVQAQISQLNMDDSRTNIDAANTPSVFQPVAVDIGIRYCLAQRDPNGNATNGIIHKSTTVTSFTTNDYAKYSGHGGDDAWPASSYLNIWVANLGGGLLGYAQFPGGNAATDGVVILYSSVGSIASPGTITHYNLGRTATHEVGHWLNLRHIWGDANCGNDQVNDTPTQQTSNFGCPAFPHVTCSNGPNGDMFCNYMDYTDDGCMNMFTAGQSARIDAIFAQGGPRFSITTSQGCIPASAISCNNSLEPNEKKSTAIPINAGEDVQSQIATSTDLDFFSFTNTSANHNIKVTLGTLVTNYSLKLFSPSGTIVGTSHTSGTADEVIIYNTSTVGTYKVKVSGVNGAYSTSCYTLHVYEQGINF